MFKPDVGLYVTYQRIEDSLFLRNLNPNADKKQKRKNANNYQQGYLKQRRKR